jgi:hypothetical protein
MRFGLTLCCRRQSAWTPTTLAKRTEVEQTPAVGPPAAIGRGRRKCQEG